jgi:hypothetical protein
MEALHALPPPSGREVCAYEESALGRTRMAAGALHEAVQDVGPFLRDHFARAVAVSVAIDSESVAPEGMLLMMKGCISCVKCV